MLQREKPWMAQILAAAATCQRDGLTVALSFQEASQCAILKKAEHDVALRGYLRDFFQEDLRIVAAAPEDSPGISQDETRRRRQQMADDPLTQEVVKMFGGGISDIRIGR